MRAYVYVRYLCIRDDYFLICVILVKNYNIYGYNNQFYLVIFKRVGRNKPPSLFQIEKGVHMSRPLKNKKDQELLADQEKSKMYRLWKRIYS